MQNLHEIEFHLGQKSFQAILPGNEIDSDTWQAGHILLSHNIIPTIEGILCPGCQYHLAKSNWI